MKKYLSEKINIYSTNGNLIRFSLAVAVIVHHSFYLSQNIHDPLYDISNGQITLGGISVWGFFFFSGLYVSKSMHKAKNCWKFFIARIKRIFPPLWVVVLCCVLILGPLMTSFSTFDYFRNLDTYKYFLNMILIPVHNLPGVFEQNVYGPTVNGSLWTLPVEFACYIAILAIMFMQKHIFKSEKFFLWIDILGFFSSLLLYIVSIYLGFDLLKSAFMAVVFFFIGVLFYDYRNRILLDWKILLVFCLLFILSIIFNIGNYGVMLFLPYLLIYLSLGLNQIRFRWKILARSYEIYLVGFPVQQTIIALYGGEMPVWINALSSTAVVLAIMIIVEIVVGFARSKSKKK